MIITIRDATIVETDAFNQVLNRPFKNIKSAIIMSRFDLNLLVALDALLSESSVTAASKRIGVTQSAMSGMLARLREQLQDPLLVRMGNSLVATPRGVMLQPEIRQLLLQAQKLLVPEREFRLAEASRRIKIMATEHSAILILPLVFRRAAESAPRLSFDILAIEAPAQSVAIGNVDLCLTGDPSEEIGKAASDVLRTRTVLLEQFVAIVDKDHPIRESTISLDELQHYPHVVTQFRGVSRTVEEIVVSRGSGNFTKAISVPNFITLGPAILNSNRIGIIPSTLVPLITSIWPLRSLTLPKEVPPTSLRSLWHVRNDTDPVHQWLRRTIEEVCFALIRP